MPLNKPLFLDEKNPCTTSLCYQDEIQHILESSQIDPGIFEQTIQNYLQVNQNLGSSIEYLYREAMIYKNDPERYSVLMQELQKQPPLELRKTLLSKLLQDYTTQNSQALYTLARAFNLTEESSVQELNPADIKAIQNTQDLFIRILKNSNDPIEVETAIDLIDVVLPEEQAFELATEAEERINPELSLKNTANPNRSSPDLTANKNKDQNPSKLFGFKVRHLLFSDTPETFDQNLNALAQENSRSSINKAIFARIKNMDVRELDPKVKQKISDYILSQKPSCLSTQEEYQASCFRDFSSWIWTFLVISEVPAAEKYDFILSQILTIQNPDTAANIFLAYKPQEFSGVRLETLAKFKHQLQILNSQTKNNFKSHLELSDREKAYANAKFIEHIQRQ